jgi:hypothetical protein
MKRPPKKWKCKDGMKTPEQMDLEELKILLNVCHRFNACCGYNEESYNQQLWINEAEKVQNLINQKETLK